MRSSARSARTRSRPTLRLRSARVARPGRRRGAGEIDQVRGQTSAPAETDTALQIPLVCVRGRVRAAGSVDSSAHNRNGFTGRFSRVRGQTPDLAVQDGSDTDARNWAMSFARRSGCSSDGRCAQSS